MNRRIGALLPKSRRARIACAASLLCLIAVVVGWKWALVTWKIRSARAALVAGDFERAVAELEAAERFQPERPELLYLLAKAYRRSDRVDEFTRYLKRAEEAGWAKDDLQNQRYLALVQIGRFDRAQPFLEQTVQKGADDELAEEFYEAKSKGCLRTYRLVEARVCLGYWIKWKPRSIQPRLWLADVNRRVSDWKAAVEEYRTILEIDENHAEAHLQLAGCLLQLQDAQGALTHYEKTLSLRPDDITAAIGRAQCERQLAIADDPAARFRDLLKRDLSDGQRVDVLVELAQIEFRDSSRPKEAIRLLKQAEKLAPHHEPTHATLAAAYRRIGSDALAKQHEAEAKASQARLDRLVEITRQIVHSPQDPELRYEAGKIYLEQGMKEAGLGWMRTALQLNPQHQKARLALAGDDEQRGKAPIALEK